MATITRENIGVLHDKISVKLSKEDYMPSFEQSLKSYARTANIPGFRKGMVPNGMIRKMYGQSLFGDEILRTASKKLDEYLRTEKIEYFAHPMSLPNEGMTLDMDQPGEMDFSFEIGLKPAFEIPAIQDKVPVTQYKIELTDKMIEDEIERLSRKFGKVEDQEVVMDTNDIIHARYEEVDANDEVLEGHEHAEDTVLLEKLPTALQELLKGKKADDSIVFVPSEVASEDELAQFMEESLKATINQTGQRYRLTISKVGRMIPREVDASLFAEIFPSNTPETIEAFKEQIKAELAKEYDRITLDQFNNEIFELLVHKTPLELPVPFLKRWLKEGGEKLKTNEEVEAEFSTFDHQLRWTLITEKLKQDYNITVSGEEVIEDIKGKVLSYFGMQGGDDAEWLDSYMEKVKKDEKMIQETHQGLLFHKIFDFLRTQLNVTEVTISEDEFFKMQQESHAHHHHH